MKSFEFLNIVFKCEIDFGIEFKSFENSLSDFEVKGIASDSRKVQNDFIFFAIKGYKEDGEKYIDEAVKNGAKVIFRDSDEYGTSLKNGIAVINVKEIRKLVALSASEFYGNPSSKLKMIGVTGTNGKTTISYLIRHLIESSGKKCGLIGTIDYITGKNTFTAALTTPDSIDVFSILNEMVESDMEYCVMEVSSIALVLDRVYGINFAAGIFTNLTSEHLDLHKNMENYFDAKKILFDNLDSNAVAISNSDDIYGERILADSKAKKYFYSIEKKSDYKADNVYLNLTGLKFILGKNEITSKLTGRFNVYNILSAVAVVENIGISLDIIAKYLKEFNAPAGRFNTIELPNKAFAVVDYSHTSDSLLNAIMAANDIIKGMDINAKVITLFGCGGNKDKTKRPVMGKYAVENSDYVIITSDNPRFEEPLEIINEILVGVGDKKNYEIDENRESAIRKAIEISKPGDIILICGKGHETYQIIKGTTAHFDDKEIVEKYKHLAIS